MIMCHNNRNRDYAIIIKFYYKIVLQIKENYEKVGMFLFYYYYFDKPRSYNL